MEYNVGYEGMPISSIVQFLKLRKIARKCLKKVTCPALIIQSHQDDSVHPKAALYINKHIRSQSKEIFWLNKSLHLCTIGPERDLMNQKILTFLENEDYA